MKSSRLSPPVARRGFVRPLLLLAVAGFALLAPQGASTAPSQPASNPDALAGIRPETRLVIGESPTNPYLRVADLKSKSNTRIIAVPRQVAMYLCKLLTKASLPEIGREFGGKHHTTVIHSINKINGLYEQKGSFHRLINSLIASCK